MKEHDIKLEPSTLENIDTAFFSYIDNLKIGTNTNGGWLEVPVVWQGAEKAFQVKNDKEIRDLNDMLILPQITVRRESVSKRLDYKGIFLNNSPKQDPLQGGEITIARKINSEKTSAFANNYALKVTKGKLNFKTAVKENPKVVYEFLSIPTPVYLDIGYEIVLRSEYQLHINDMVTVFLTHAGSLNYFLIANNGYRYECFYDEDLTDNSNLISFDEEERIFKTVISVRVLGYIIGDNKNENRPKLTRRENRVDLKIQEVILTDNE